jgi:hypothetical protein
MWCVKLSDSQRDALRALVREQDKHRPTLTAALEALDLARWDDLPEATLPWDRVSELAAKQGIGEADVVWDLTACIPPEPKQQPPVPVRRRGRRAKPPA